MKNRLQENVEHFRFQIRIKSALEERTEYIQTAMARLSHTSELKRSELKS